MSAKLTFIFNTKGLEFLGWTFLYNMEEDDGLKDNLRLQFQALQEQQEKRLQRRLEKQKKEQKATEIQDNLDLSQLDIHHEDDCSKKWALWNIIRLYY